MIDHDDKDFADINLNGPMDQRLIIAQRLMDAIKKLNIHFYTLLRSNIDTRDSVEGIAEKTQEYIKRVGVELVTVAQKLEPLNQNVNLLIQDVRTVQAKLDAMENRLLLLLPYAWHPTVPTNPENPPYGTFLGPVTCEAKSYAEKEYSDNTATKEKKP